MIGLLFLNGKPPDKKLLKELDFDQYFVVCADGAYNYLYKYCKPDILVGDFDSTHKKQLCAKKIERLERDKDYTDGHIAMLRLIENCPEKILIYGALGGFPDHELSNYSLLALAASHKKDAVIISEDFCIFYADGSFRHRTGAGKRISLVPFTDTVHILGTRGLKFPIENERYNKLHIKGISNLSTESEIGFDIAEGAALIFVEI